MAEIRPATRQDIEGIAALFNSDQSYRDPWFSDAEQIRKRYKELGSRSIARLVVEDGRHIIGYIAAEEFYLTDQDDPHNGRVAEVKKVFVEPGHRKKEIASCLLSVVESEILEAGYDFAVATAVCGHTASQTLFDRNGYMAT